MRNFVCAAATACGGCPGLVVGDYEPFVQAKFQRLQQVLDSVHVHIDPTLQPIENPVAYRRRIRLRCVDGRLEFFNPNKDVACLVLTMGLRSFVECLFEVSAAQPDLFMGVSHLEVRDADLDGLFGISRFGQAWHSGTAIQSAFGQATVVSEGDQVGPVQRLRLTNQLDYFVPLRSFLQINGEVNRQIQSRLAAVCRDLSLDSFWDLYCGAGNLSLRLAASGMSGGGVEINSEAIHAAQRSVSRWTDRVAYRVANARDDMALPSFTPDIVIANPPRAGLKQGIGQIVELGAANVFLMSCSLESLERDLIGLMRAGYAIADVRAYDMFPFTDHLETTVLARRP